MDVTVASPEFTARMFDDVVKLQNPVRVLPPDIRVGLRHGATNPWPTRLWHRHHKKLVHFHRNDTALRQIHRHTAITNQGHNTITARSTISIAQLNLNVHTIYTVTVWPLLVFTHWKACEPHIKIRTRTVMDQKDNVKMNNDNTHTKDNGYSVKQLQFHNQYTSLSQTHFLYSISFLFSCQTGWGLSKHVGYPRFNLIENFI
jgi:hypothetical protein